MESYVQFRKWKSRCNAFLYASIPKLGYYTPWTIVIRPKWLQSLNGHYNDLSKIFQILIIIEMYRILIYSTYNMCIQFVFNTQTWLNSVHSHIPISKAAKVQL